MQEIRCPSKAPRLPAIGWLACLSFLVLALPVPAQLPDPAAGEVTELLPTVMYGFNGGRLWVIDRQCGAATPVGASVADIVDRVEPTAALGNTVSTGQEYGFTYHGERLEFYGLTTTWPNPQLFRVDLITGYSEVVGPLRSATRAFDTAEGIAYNPLDGLLYVSAGFGFYSRWLGTIDPDTAVVTEIAPLRNDFQHEADGLAWAGGQLYATDGAYGYGFLFRVDHQTGAMSRVGPMTGGQSWAGFAWDGSRAVYTAEGWTRELDLATGQSTTIGPAGVQRMWGNALAPALSPAAVAVLAGICPDALPRT